MLSERFWKAVSNFLNFAMATNLKSLFILFLDLSSKILNKSFENWLGIGHSKTKDIM